MGWLVILCRVTLSATFALAAIMKLLHPRQPVETTFRVLHVFEEDSQAGPFVGRITAWSVVIATSTAEVALAALLMGSSGTSVTIAAASALGLMIAFVPFRRKANALALPCGCFGSTGAASRQSIDWLDWSTTGSAGLLFGLLVVGRHPASHLLSPAVTIAAFGVLVGAALLTERVRAGISDASEVTAATGPIHSRRRFLTLAGASGVGLLASSLPAHAKTTLTGATSTTGTEPRAVGLALDPGSSAVLRADFDRDPIVHALSGELGRRGYVIFSHGGVTGMVHLQGSETAQSLRLPVGLQRTREPAGYVRYLKPLEDSSARASFVVASLIRPDALVIGAGTDPSGAVRVAELPKTGQAAAVYAGLKSGAAINESIGDARVVQWRMSHTDVQTSLDTVPSPDLTVAAQRIQAVSETRGIS